MTHLQYTDENEPSASEHQQPPIRAARQRTRLVLVDDDEDFREALRGNLLDEGFDVVDFNNGVDVLKYFADGDTGDIIILDWKMPGMSGSDLFRRLRRDGVRVPVVFLTVMCDQVYEDVALGGGAVDFIDKSRSLSILVRRLKLIGERDRSAAEAPAEIGVLRRGALELSSSRAIWRGREVELTLTEFNIVRLLASRAGENTSYREIYDVVHGDGFIAGDGDNGYRTNVRACIKRIRRKFSMIDSHFVEIENCPGYGYRWR